MVDSLLHSHEHSSEEYFPPHILAPSPRLKREGQRDKYGKKNKLQSKTSVLLLQSFLSRLFGESDIYSLWKLSHLISIWITCYQTRIMRIQLWFQPHVCSLNLRTEPSKCPSPHFGTCRLWHYHFILFLKISCSMSMASLLPTHIPLTDLPQCVFDFKLSKQWVLSCRHHPLGVTFSVHHTTTMTSGFLFFLLLH